MKAKLPYLALSVIVLVLDQWTKWLVEARIELHEVYPVIPDLLNMTHVQNTGVAFGMMASQGERSGTLMLLGLGLVALFFVGLYFYWTPPEDRMLLTALGLVIGGALGNLLDRYLQGSVTDFIDFYVGTYHWHTFNIADTGISIGIGLMLLSTFLAPSAAAEEDVRAEHDRMAGPPADDDGHSTGEQATEERATEAVAP